MIQDDEQACEDDAVVPFRFPLIHNVKYSNKSLSLFSKGTVTRVLGNRIAEKEPSNVEHFETDPVAEKSLLEDEMEGGKNQE